MTTATASRPEPLLTRLKWQVNDARAVTWRNVLAGNRTPEILVFSSIQPILFILLFRFVFGGAISIPGVGYANYLLPGIFCQTVLFGSTSTAVGLAEDMQRGFVDRLRSLPMARSAVLLGRTLADGVRNIIVLVIMIVTGVLVGFRPHSVLGLLLAVVLLLSLSFAFSWPMALLGLSVKTSEAAQSASFPLIFPLTFASSAFVPTSTMPHWLRVFAENQPVTLAANAVRSLSLGHLDAAVRASALGGHSTTYLVVATLIWSSAIGSVFAALSVRKYRRL